jgi:hypothetical protein
VAGVRGFPTQRTTDEGASTIRATRRVHSLTLLLALTVVLDDGGV